MHPETLHDVAHEAASPGADWLVITASLVIVFMVLLSLWRAFRGPTVFDRAVGVGLMGTKTVVLLVLTGFAYGRLEMFVDISLSYALLGFVGVLALARYFESRGAAGWEP
jgi:multicomponent Na+:H+ antiporter subunit F